MEVHQASEQGFGGKLADAYNAGRPDYSDLSVKTMLVKSGFCSASLDVVASGTFVDLAAGTGKLTESVERVLQGKKINIVAVEPVAGMRETFSKVHPNVPCVAGTGASIPLPDGSASLIGVAQAFHWFANQESLQEMARVLQPGGVLALIWNTRDLSCDWVNKLEDEIATPHYSADVPRQQTNKWKEAFAGGQTLFGPAQAFEFPYVQHGGWQMVVNRFLTLSVIAALPEEKKKEVEQSILHVLQTHPATRDKQDSIDLPYVTQLFLFRRL
eukprot:m.132622 g.132622  ORF g.132622 m.132622 type:complete len:271 (+) comp16489_c0_seq2:58-870(+)